MHNSCARCPVWAPWPACNSSRRCRNSDTSGRSSGGACGPGPLQLDSAPIASSVRSAADARVSVMPSASPPSTPSAAPIASRPSTQSCDRPANRKARPHGRRQKALDHPQRHHARQESLHPSSTIITVPARACAHQRAQPKRAGARLAGTRACDGPEPPFTSTHRPISPRSPAPPRATAPTWAETCRARETAGTPR